MLFVPVTEHDYCMITCYKNIIIIKLFETLDKHRHVSLLLYSAGYFSAISYDLIVAAIESAMHNDA